MKFWVEKIIFVGSPAGSLKSKLDFQGKIVGGQEAEPRKYQDQSLIKNI